MDAKKGFISLYVLVISSYIFTFILTLSISNNSISNIVNGKKLLYTEIATINTIKEAYESEDEPYIDIYEYNGFNIIVDIDKENISISYENDKINVNAKCQYDKENKYIVNYEYV